MACNPTVQYNDFTGNGSTTQFTFTFPYDNTTDVHVRLGTYPNYTYPAYGTGTTEYQVDSANPTRIIFGTAPSGPIRIFRCTPNNVLPATFQAGSSIRSSDLNNNFNQILFCLTDASIRSVDAQAVADTAYTQSNQAIATANTALSTANSAVTTANAANATANAAATAVANAVIYGPVADVSSISGSPSNDDYIEVIDSTGIESFSLLVAFLAALWVQLVLPSDCVIRQILGSGKCILPMIQKHGILKSQVTLSLELLLFLVILPRTYMLRQNSM